MKNNGNHSFRLEIIIYSLLSLLCTIITEICIGLLFAGARIMVKKISGLNYSNHAKLSPETRERILNENSIPFAVPPKNNPFPFLYVIAIFAVIIGVVLFIIYFLLLTKKFASYLEEISDGVERISSGDFQARIAVRYDDEFTLIAGRLNKMAGEIENIMDLEKKEEASKNNLITCVAHDLRTPLTSILGYLDLVLKNENLSEETKKKYISIAFDKSKRLEKLIEDLFAYTKLTAKEESLHLGKIDMVQFMEQIVDEFYPSFIDNHLEYKFNVNCKSAIILGDGDLLARAIANLISNAIKYGRDGKKIKMLLLKKETEVIVTVTNYGELIPKEDLKNIFHKFYRVESSRSGETGGSGLGLAIAKDIVELHGGSIKVQSDFHGTVFEISLKLSQSEEIDDK